MNEELRVIFKQAGGYIEIDDSGNESTYTYDFDPEVFATLIIKECNNKFNDTDAVTGAFVHKVLKEHFGV
jgi:hypothetical protein